MSFRPYLTAVAMLGLFLLGLVAVTTAVGISYQDNAREFVVTNETVTVDYSNGSDVAPSQEVDQYHDDVVVYNESGAPLTEGTDFEWNATSGHVTWVNTSATTGGASASISYSYRGWPAGTATGNDILADGLLPLLPWVGLAVAALGVVIILSGIAVLVVGSGSGSLTR